MKKIFLIFLIIFFSIQIRVRADDVANNIDEISQVGKIMIYEGNLPTEVRESYEKICFVTLFLTVKENKTNQKNDIYRAGSCIPIGDGLVVTAYHLKGDVEKAIEEENKKGSSFELKIQKVVISYYLKMGIYYNDERNTIINIPGKIEKEEKDNEVIAIKANMEAFERFLNQTPDSFFKVQAQKIFSYLKTGIEIEEKIEAGEEIFVVGYSLFPAAVDGRGYFLPHIFAGKIKFQNGLIYLLAPSEPGFSGGGVLDKNGKLVAMSILSSPGRNFVVAIPARFIKSVLKVLKEEK